MTEPTTGKSVLVKHDELAEAAATDDHQQADSCSIQDRAVSINEAKKVRGLTVLTAAVIVAGEMAGIGVLALPRAVANATWIGLVLILVFGLAAMHTARLLGHCWIILQERYEEFRRQHVRYPYPAIAERAVGKWMRYVVSIAIDCTLFGVLIVFMLLASQNLQSLFHQANVNVSFCFWILVIAAVLVPLTWFGTPKDFWPLAVGALVATAIACVMVFIQSMLQIGKSTPKYENTKDFLTFFQSFGAIAFAFGGHATFPTIQHDMRQQDRFPASCILAFGAVLTMYLPVAAAGYFVYGTDVSSNVLQSLPPGPVNIIVTILVTAHLLCAFVIVINPLSQELEEVLKFQHGFTWKRCVLRTVIVLIALFVAETIPHFGAILDLVGGTSVTLLVFVSPPLFYISLCRAKGDWPERQISLHEYAINLEIMIVGVFSGVAATIGAINEIASPSTFVPPCYVNLTAASGK